MPTNEPKCVHERLTAVPTNPYEVSNEWNVDLEVEAGRITALIGPNGAGKTTTFNVITGLQETTSGRVVLDGQELLKLPPHQRARRGIGARPGPYLLAPRIKT